MNRFHKICYEAVLGLGVLCLWFEFTRFTFNIFESWTPGFFIGMFFIGWALTYKDENEKQQHDELSENTKEILETLDELKKESQYKKKD